MQEKGGGQHSLSGVAKEQNREGAKTRFRMEHVFGEMGMTMGGKLTGCIGLVRVKAWRCLQDLVFNCLRFTQHECGPGSAQRSDRVDWIVGESFEHCPHQLLLIP